MICNLTFTSTLVDYHLWQGELSMTFILWLSIFSTVCGFLLVLHLQNIYHHGISENNRDISLNDKKKLNQERTKTEKGKISPKKLQREIIIKKI